jgi:hypothetical protein
MSRVKFIGPVSQRSLQEYNEFITEFEAEEMRKQQEEERPLREAQSRLEETATELARMERDNLRQLPDDDFYVTPGMERIRMSLEKAGAFNQAEALRFIAETPGYYPCPENLAAIMGYFERNGVRIYDCAMLKAAFEKLHAAGLLKDEPKPTPAPIQQYKPLTFDDEPEPKPKGQTGIDPATGKEHFYSNREINLMSAAEYKNIFQLRSVGPGEWIFDPSSGRELYR